MNFPLILLLPKITKLRVLLNCCMDIWSGVGNGLPVTLWAKNQMNPE